MAVKFSRRVTMLVFGKNPSVTVDGDNCNITVEVLDFIAYPVLVRHVRGEWRWCIGQLCLRLET